MKDWMPILLIFFLPVLCMGQTFDFSAQFYSESYGQKIIPTNDGKWYFAGKIFPGLWENKQFTVVYGAISSTGSLFPFSPVEFHDNSNALALVQRENGNILLGAEDVECEVIGNGVVYEIDDEGEVLFNYPLPHPCQDFMEIKTYLNNTFVSCGAGISQVLDNGATNLFYTSPQQITAFIPLYNNWTITAESTADGDHLVQKVDAAGQILQTLYLTDGGPIHQMEGLGFDRNVILQRNNIYLVNDNLNILEEHSVQNVTIEFTSMAFDEDEIYVLGRDLDDNIIVFGFNHQLELVNNHSFASEGLQALDLALHEDEIALVGTGHSGVYLDTVANVPGNFIAGRNFWIKSFDKAGIASQPLVDVALGGISSSAPVCTATEYSCNGMDILSGKKVEFENIQIQVINHGEEVLQKVVANTRVVGCPADCNYEVETLVTHEFNNLNLAPGADIWLTIDDFEALFADDYTPKLCMWLSTPDQKIDANPSDNVLCDYFFGPVSTTEIEPGNDLAIRPNPVGQTLNITLDQPLQKKSTAKIFDTYGQQIETISIPSTTNRIEFPVDYLSPGVYSLHFENRQHIRFVKL